MREELLKLSNELENVTATLAEIVEKEAVQGEISFTRLELRNLLNSFYDSIVEQACSNDVSHDLIDVSFDLDYDHRVTLDEAYLSREFLDFDVNEFLVDAIREKIKKEVREEKENEDNKNTNVNTCDTVSQLQC
tara:strand:- start:286 stop:687 length:402 start_codon:yes stop_codon:yes gene_type:complete